MRGKFVSYLRVSTQKQGHSGLGLEAQREAIQHYLNGGKWQLIAELKEIESGKRSDRPKLAEALRLCRLHRAKLIVPKIDRLARSVAFISALMESGVEFIAVDLPEANKLTVHIMAAMAEHEAEAISARTKAALAASKKPLGGLRRLKATGEVWNLGTVAGKGAEASVKARRASAAEYHTNVLPSIEEARGDGAVSLRQIAAWLNEHEVPTPRGGQWSAIQVQRILTRQAEAK